MIKIFGHTDTSSPSNGDIVIRPLKAKVLKGDKVTYKEQHYISDVDNNVWAPDVYGWSII